MNNKMKIIDLLTKVANGEEVPEIIRYQGVIFKWDSQLIAYYDKDDNSLLQDYLNNTSRLNDEVEILEKQDARSLFEAVGYAFGETEKCFKNGYDKSINETNKLSSKIRYYFSGVQNGMTKQDRQALDDMFDTVYKEIDRLSEEVNELRKEV